MKAKNTTKLSGSSLRSAAFKIAKKIKRYQHAYYASDGRLVAVSGVELTWFAGAVGDYGFCNGAAREAEKNPGFIFIG